jgi:hypothetical protein
MAAAATYEPIATQTLSSAATLITFSSIPATYTDLRVVVNYISVSGGTTNLGLRINSNSNVGGIYYDTYMRSIGSAAQSSYENAVTLFDFLGYYGASDTIPALSTIDIFSYAGSTNKTLLWTEANNLNGTGQVYAAAGLWDSTAAITSLYLRAGNYNFGIGTTATLYGIKAA